MYPTNPKLVEVNPSWCMQICVHESLVGACKFVFMKSVHASIDDHVFLVPSPNLHDFSLNPSSISYLGNPSWSMQIVVHEILLGAWKYL